MNWIDSIHFSILIFGVRLNERFFIWLVVVVTFAVFVQKFEKNQTLNNSKRYSRIISSTLIVRASGNKLTKSTKLKKSNLSALSLETSNALLSPLSSHDFDKV